LLEAEFFVDGTPDLNLSVYDVSPSQVVRTFAEHNASAGNLPPTGRTNVDLSGAPAHIVVDELRGPFSLINSAHRELRFSDADSLREFVRYVRSDLDARAHPVQSRELKAFVRERLAAGDPEWTSFVEGQPRWKL
jgi:hypothetical protein